LPPLILPEVLGPICKRCERNTSSLYDTKKGLCPRCFNKGSLLNPASQIPSYLYFGKEEKRESLTLVFTCTRHSGGDNFSNEEETFKTLEMSCRQSQRFSLKILIMWNFSYITLFPYAEVTAHLEWLTILVIQRQLNL
jgi:hypothetical protein